MLWEQGPTHIMTTQKVKPLMFNSYSQWSTTGDKASPAVKVGLIYPVLQ